MLTDEQIEAVVDYVGDCDVRSVTAINWEPELRGVSPSFPEPLRSWARSIDLAPTLGFASASLSLSVVGRLDGAHGWYLVDLRRIERR